MSAALIAKLIEAGTPAELVAEVAMELSRAQAAAEILEQRRKHERERKARSRDVTGQNVTERDSRDNADRVSLDKEKSPIPPKEINPIPCVRNARTKAKHSLPTNWLPAPLKADGQAGLVAARKPVGWIERELSKFKDHALQNRRLCADWDAAWRNWIKQADEYDGRQRTDRMGRDQSPDGLSPTTRAALAVFGSSPARRQ